MPGLIMDSKLNTLNQLLSTYSRSIKQILNIASSTNLDEGKFNICGIDYKQEIDQQRLSNWVLRHAYIDSFELSQEIINQLFTNVYNTELGFTEKASVYRKKGQNCKNLPKKYHLLPLHTILQILKKDNDFNKHLDLFEQYKKNRNCLTHRFGRVSEHDNPPLQLSLFRTLWFVRINDEIFEYSTAQTALTKLNENTTTKNKTLELHTHHKQTETFQEHEIMQITPEALYSLNIRLFDLTKSILVGALEEHIPDISTLVDNVSPFITIYELHLNKK